MKKGKNPDPDVIHQTDVIHPVTGYDNEICVKPPATAPDMIVDDFTCTADTDDFVEDIHDPCLRFQR